MKKKKADKVSLNVAGEREFKAPQLGYQPRGPRKPKTKLGLIGCGGITAHHLAAAKSLGAEVVAMADPDLDAARARRDEFFPGADIYDDARHVFERDDVTAVDIATHPAVRAGQIELALKAGKHVLSQKPFVLDLGVGRKLVRLAQRRNLVLAVNQNGRWAPYFAWLLAANRKGLLGELQSFEATMNWDHTWTRGTAFEKIHHLVLYDFAIHWIDIAAQIFEGRKAKQVFANAVHARAQAIKPPAVANIAIEFEHGLATLAFDAHSMFGAEEQFVATGDKGTLRGAGPLCGISEVDLHTKRGHARALLEGSWFPDGFRGTLGEFLLAIEKGREPSHAAKGNLRSLEICFAALASADTGQPVRPGSVKAVSK